jgi:hypothetical protein
MGKICRHCGDLFQPSRTDQEYCSPAHQKAAKAERDHLCGPNTANLSRATVRALNRAAVAVDLASRGWDVYQAFSEASAFDVLAHQGARELRVVARSAYRRGAKLYSPGAQEVPGVTFALVHDRGIEYRPELPARVPSGREEPTPAAPAAS